MPAWHQTIVVGHLGRDVELRYLPNGDPVANVSVAVTERFKDKSGDQREDTTWYSVNVFGRLAEVCGEYLRKGMPVMFVGRMKARKYTDKNDVERTVWELRADSMQMLGSAQRSESAHEEPPRSKQTPKSSSQSKTSDDFSDMADDIPF